MVAESKRGATFPVSFGANLRIQYPEKLVVGTGIKINDDVWINAFGGVTIGDNVLIGPKVIIHSANHNYQEKDLWIRRQGHTLKPVTIGDDVWIGAGAIILPGVTVGDGAVVGAGAVVTKNVAAYTVVVGNPARQIGRRT